MMTRRVYRSDLFHNIYRLGLLYGRAKARGEANDWIEEKARIILFLLSVRHISVSDEIRDKILRCKNMHTLYLWLGRAAVEPTAAAVVEVEAVKRPAAQGPSPSPKRPPARSAQRSTAPAARGASS